MKPLESELSTTGLPVADASSSQPLHRTYPAAVTTLKKVSLAVGLVIALSVGAMLYVLLHMGRNLDELAVADTRRLFSSLLDLQARQLATQTMDYANWDEAIESLIVQKDSTWWTANAGEYAVKAFDLSFSLMFDGEDKLVFSAYGKSPPLEKITLAGESSLRALMRHARSRQIEGSAAQIVATGLVKIQGQVYSVAAVRFRPETAASKPNPSPDTLLLFGRSLPDSVLPITAEVMGLPDLHLGAAQAAGKVSVLLTLTDEEPAGVVTWPSTNPGQKLIGNVMPWIAGLLFIVLTAVLYAAIRTKRLAREILAESALREALALRSRSILDAVRDGVVGVDIGARVSFFNPAAMATFGQPTALPTDVVLTDILPPATVAEIHRALAVGQSCTSVADVITDARDRAFPAEISVSIVRQNERITGAVVVFRDITERKAIEDQVFRRANFDVLTGAPNRSLFSDYLTGEIVHAHKHGGSGAVFLIDIDRFKKVNDSMGHEVGDLLLQQTYKRLTLRLDDSVTVARHGGDEFSLLVPNVDTKQAVFEIASNLIVALNESFDLLGNSVWTGGSIGIAFYPQDGVTAADLMRHVEIAMYKAKQDGQNGIRLYEQSMTENIQAYRSLEVSLRNAIAQKQLFLLYQPIVNLKTRQLSHVEALVRWMDTDRSVISPDTFIPLAEETGLIVEIGAWVLEESCRQLSEWRKQGLHESVGITVNVSGRQVPSGLSVQTVENMLGKYRLPAYLIGFEITESVMFNKSPAVMLWFQGIRALGIRLMIDDFGTGYSSLSYLKHFRAGAIKVDKSFIAGVVDGVEDQSLVNAILAMAHSLDLPVVAEGVETEAQSSWLLAHGCDYAQGYLFAKPMPACDLISFQLTLS